MLRKWIGRRGAIALTAAVGLMGGCASSSRQDDSTAHEAVSGMMCPKCETMWVGPHSRGEGTKVQAYHWGREEVCPDCEAMAKAYVKDGQQVLHECPTCKVTPQPVTPVAPTGRLGTHI